MPKKILKGIVVSDKPNKTITVLERKFSHPLLKKVIKVKKKYNAHDENNKFKTGTKFQLLRANHFQKIKNFKQWRVINNDTGSNRINGCR